MKKVSVLLSLFVSMSSVETLAAASEIVHVTGVVISFDNTSAKILNHGQITLVPRSSLSDKPTVGEKVQVSFNLEEFKKTLPN